MRVLIPRMIHASANALDGKDEAVHELCKLCIAEGLVKQVPVEGMENMVDLEMKIYRQDLHEYVTYYERCKTRSGRIPDAMLESYACGLFEAIHNLGFIHVCMSGADGKVKFIASTMVEGAERTEEVET